MMDRDQAEVVKLVYNRFMDNEGDTWTELDDNIEFCSHLSDSELIDQVTEKYKKHSKSIFRCNQNHDQQYCFAPYILDSVEAILRLYKKTKNLHEKNRYILTYYIAMTEMKLIFSA